MHFHHWKGVVAIFIGAAVQFREKTLRALLPKNTGCRRFYNTHMPDKETKQPSPGTPIKE